MRGFGSVDPAMPPRRRAKPRSAEHAALGVAIQRLRKEAGLSQEALADRSGIHMTHIGGLERGVRNPSYATLVRLAAALQIGVGSLALLADEIRDEAG
jgi:transcriptional regulator with XRE-family HTH domain